MALSEKIDELRDVLNSSICYKQKTWNQKDGGAWDKLWVSFDNIQDTQLAIDEFNKIESFSRLSVYGVLQALVVQQDAIKSLEESIELQTWSFADYPKLKDIRDIRNETIGHPVSTGDNKKDSSYENGGITHTSISHNNKANILEYATWSKDGFNKKEIDLRDITKIQEELLIQEIDKVMVKIKINEKNHAEKFKNESLQKRLAQSGYFIQKLWPFERERVYSQTCFDSLKTMYELFKEDIKARYNVEVLDEFGVSIPGVILEIQKIDKLIPRVEKMILLGEGTDVLDLEVYVESLDNAFVHLVKMAKEIDEKFDSIINYDPMVVLGV